MSKTPSDDDVKFAAEMMLANAEAEACDDENSDETRLAARCDGIIAGFYLRHLADLTRVTAERDALKREVEENTGVIAVWRGRTLRAEAERDKLRSALEAVAKVTGKYGGQMSDLFGHDEEFNDAFGAVDAVLAETHKPQPQPQPEN